MLEGCIEGKKVGFTLGWCDGIIEGRELGYLVGIHDGLLLGFNDG
jgi:hypothetical protein